MLKVINFKNIRRNKIMNKIEQKLLNKLAVAQYNEVVLEAQVEELQEKINQLEAQKENEKEGK